MRLSLVSLLAIGAATALVAPPASAANSNIVFDTIDAYRADYAAGGGGSLEVTGVVHGASAASTMTFQVQSEGSGQACERALLLAINRPGRVTVTIVPGGFGYASCLVSRNP